MTNVFDVLTERGFIQQTSHPEELWALTPRPTACTSGITYR